MINTKKNAGARTLRWIMLAAFALLIIVPLSIVVFASFKSTPELFTHPIGWPKEIIFVNYWRMLTEYSLGTYFLNSVLITLATVASILFLSSLLAYAVVRLNTWLSIGIFGLFVAGMMVPPQVNMIPIYSLVYNLGLTNSRLGLILVSIAVFMPTAMFIITGFMRQLPNELYEAASIDGAGEWRMYSRIVLPVSMPSISAGGIFLSVMVWNDLLYPLLFITSNDRKTLPLALLQFQGEFITDFPMIFAGVIVASIPMVVAYLLLQRYFVEGVTAGSVKG
jgi:raffinose/stachyose/melibiose transport system permease protein